MAFLVLIGVIQFVYCVLAGNYVRCLVYLPYPYTHIPSSPTHPKNEAGHTFR